MEFKVIKLKRNGPKNGQSTEAWLAGKKLEAGQWNAKVRRFKETGERQPRHRRYA